jgi:hypothetical protein
MLRLDERKWSSTNEGLLQLLAKVMAVGLAPKEKLIRWEKGLSHLSSTLSLRDSPLSGPSSADDPADVIDVVRSVPRVMPPVTAASALDVADGARGCPPAIVGVL